MYNVHICYLTQILSRCSTRFLFAYKCLDGNIIKHFVWNERKKTKAIMYKRNDKPVFLKTFKIATYLLFRCQMSMKLSKRIHERFADTFFFFFFFFTLLSFPVLSVQPFFFQSPPSTKEYSSIIRFNWPINIWILYIDRV